MEHCCGCRRWTLDRLVRFAWGVIGLSLLVVVLWLTLCQGL